MTSIMPLVAAALLAAIVLIYVLTRVVAARKERYQHVACPGCMRKLRYRSRQTGHSVICPQCARRFNLPGHVRPRPRVKPRA